MDDRYETMLREAAHVFWTHGKEEGEQLRQHDLELLARSSDESMPILRKALWSSDKILAATAIDAIDLIGYPGNEPVLPDLLRLIGQADPNSPAWLSALLVLMHLGPDIVIPHLIKAFLEKEGPYHRLQSGESPQVTWARDVEGLCFLLTRTTLGSEYARRCCPTINYLLAQVDQDTSIIPNVVDSLFSVLEEAGTDIAYVLPTIIALINKFHDSDVGRHAKELFFSFPREALASYKLVFAQELDGYV